MAIHGCTWMFQSDKKSNPDKVGEIHDKDTICEYFEDIEKACPTESARLKTLYGLPDKPTPLMKLHLDLYQ